MEEIDRARRIARYTVALEELLKIPEAERDDWALGSIAYNTECLFHLGAPLPQSKPHKPKKANGK